MTPAIQTLLASLVPLERREASLEADLKALREKASSTREALKALGYEPEAPAPEAPAPEAPKPAHKIQKPAKPAKKAPEPKPEPAAE